MAYYSMNLILVRQREGKDVGRHIKKYIWVLPIIWMVVIFSFSHQPGYESGELSGGVTDFIIKILDSLNFRVDGFRLHTIVRAGAHFTVFFVLGSLWYISLRINYVSKIRAGIWALGICFLYALFDEGHQYFVPGRVCDIKDVVIDTLGGGTGILAIKLLLAFRRRVLA